MADPVLGIALNPDLDEHQKLHTFAKEVCAKGSSVSALGRFALSKLQEAYGGNFAALAQDVARYDDFARARHEAYGELLKRRDTLERKAALVDKERDDLEKQIAAFGKASEVAPTVIQDATERMKGVMSIVRKAQAQQ